MSCWEKSKHEGRRERQRVSNVEAEDYLRKSKDDGEGNRKQIKKKKKETQKKE